MFQQLLCQGLSPHCQNSFWAPTKHLEVGSGSSWHGLAKWAPRHDTSCALNPSPWRPSSLIGSGPSHCPSREEPGAPADVMGLEWAGSCRAVLFCTPRSCCVESGPARPRVTRVLGVTLHMGLCTVAGQP